MGIRKASRLALVAALLANGAMAADQCSDWMVQADGSYWRQCIDANGQIYCQVMTDGTISRVKCQ